MQAPRFASLAYQVLSNLQLINIQIPHSRLIGEQGNLDYCVALSWVSDFRFTFLVSRCVTY